MLFLISGAWIIGEAAEEGVVVSQHDVDATFQQERRQNFKNAKEFRRFLRQSGETVADLKFRVRIDLLTSQLRNKISPDALTAKWRRRTRCAAAYHVADCGGTL